MNKFLNNYLHDLKDANPELEIIEAGSAFWNKINEHSNMLNRYDIYWPLEMNDAEIDENDEEDISSGLVFNIDTWDWRKKSPDEIENTKDDDNIVKYDIENELFINFK